MKNTHFKFPYYTTEDGIQLRDIFSVYKNKKLSDKFISDLSGFWYYKNVQDNTRLELLAYTEYSDSSMWDILFLINQMDNVWDLPKSEDYIATVVQEKMDEFNFLFSEARMAETKDMREKELYEMYFQLNEKHRKLRFINKQHIPNFLEAVREYNK